MTHRIIQYIQRMRSIRRWAVENNDSIMYNMVNDEVQWWKKVLQRII